jgi:hypothetical protein
MFCKLYDSPEHKQIIIKLDTNDNDESEVQLYWVPTGLGVCQMALIFNDTAKAERVFNKITLEIAEEMINQIAPQTDKIRGLS